MNDSDQVIQTQFARDESPNCGKWLQPGYVIFSSGSYSSYQEQIFFILKPFKLSDVAAEFLADWETWPKYIKGEDHDLMQPVYAKKRKGQRVNWLKFGESPSNKDFIDWMEANKYIFEDEVKLDIFIGEYDFEPERMGIDTMGQKFEPAEYSGNVAT